MRSDTRFSEVSLILAIQVIGQWLSKMEQSGGKCFKFVSTCHAISKSKNLASLFFWSGKFIQKVLWEENTCEEGIFVGQSARRKK